MKKLLLSILSITFMACSNDSTNSFSDVLESSSPDISVVAVSGNKISTITTRTDLQNAQLALKFKNRAVLEKFKEELDVKSDAEKIERISKFGITTLHDIAKIADEELEEIDIKASSKEEFYLLYNQYTHKYKNILISNNLDETDLTLYVPDDENIESYISNINKVYVVGDAIIKANIKDELSDGVKRMTRAVFTNAQPVNYSVYSPKDGKRVYFHAYMRNIRMFVQMYCKKKMWYGGWKNDPGRSYYFTPSLNNITYLSQGPHGQEFVTSPLPRYIHDKNVKDGFNYILGKMNSNRAITGEIQAWTDMTTEYDAQGRPITEIINGVSVPKCNKDKAQIIKIHLTPNN